MMQGLHNGSHERGAEFAGVEEREPGMELAERANGPVVPRVDAQSHRWRRAALARPRPWPTSPPGVHSTSEAEAGTAPGLEELWKRHGRALYAFACALLGDEAAAVQAVTLAMVDLARTSADEWPREIPRYLSERVYWRSQALTMERSSPSPVLPIMGWLARLARLQRTCLALCAFGGYPHREAADLLDVAPATVAELLTTGLRELGHLAAGGPAIA